MGPKWLRSRKPKPGIQAGVEVIRDLPPLRCHAN
jgi:hypothetical protein